MPGHGTLPSRYAIAAFDALSAHVAILDSTGTVAAVNRAWANFARENGGTSGLGSNYLDICANANGPDQDDALKIMVGIQDVLRADADVFEMEYPCHSSTEQQTSCESHAVPAMAWLHTAAMRLTRKAKRRRR